MSKKSKLTKDPREKGEKEKTVEEKGKALGNKLTDWTEYLKRSYQKKKMVSKKRPGK